MPPHTHPQTRLPPPPARHQQRLRQILAPQRPHRSQPHGLSSAALPQPRRRLPHLLPQYPLPFWQGIAHPLRRASGPQLQPSHIRPIHTKMSNPRPHRHRNRQRLLQRPHSGLLPVLPPPPAPVPPPVVVVQPQPRPGRGTPIRQVPQQGHIPADAEVMRPDQHFRPGQAFMHLLHGLSGQHLVPAAQITKIPVGYHP